MINILRIVRVGLLEYGFEWQMVFARKSIPCISWFWQMMEKVFDFIVELFQMGGVGAVAVGSVAVILITIFGKLRAKNLSSKQTFILFLIGAVFILPAFAYVIVQSLATSQEDVVIPESVESKIQVDTSKKHVKTESKETFEKSKLYWIESEKIRNCLEARLKFRLNPNASNIIRIVYDDDLVQPDLWNPGIVKFKGGSILIYVSGQRILTTRFLLKSLKGNTEGSILAQINRELENVVCKEQAAFSKYINSIE